MVETQKSKSEPENEHDLSPLNAEVVDSPSEVKTASIGLDYYSPYLLPFLWYPAVLKHFASSIWSCNDRARVGVEERWASEKDQNSYRVTLMEYFLLRQKSVKNMEDKDHLLHALNGGAILPPLPMDEYFSTARAPEFTAPSCSHLHFSFLFISAT